MNFITQLNSLKAALNKIGEWINSDLADVPQHHQLVIDLKDSITCYKMCDELDGQTNLEVRVEQRVSI